MQMLGTARHITFHSPQGGGTDIEVQEKDGRPITLRQCIEQFQQEQGFRHSLEQYHFSINADEILDMDRPLNYVNTDMCVATQAKVGGSQ
jgi:hypothetical protein